MEETIKKRQFINEILFLTVMFCVFLVGEGYANGQIIEPTIIDERFATSTMDIAQQEQVIWLEQRIKNLEQNDVQIIYLLEKILGL